MYHIVIFEKTNEVEVVPSNWVKENECMWPPNKVDVVKATKNKEQPGEGWTPHRVRIIFTSNSYSEARLKLPEAVEHTDLATDREDSPIKPKRRRMPKNLFFPGEDEDEKISVDQSKDNAKKRKEELPRAPKIFHSFASDSQRMQKTGSTQKSVLAKSKPTKFLPNIPPNSQSHHTSNVPKRTHTHSDQSRRNHATADPLERSRINPDPLQRSRTSNQLQRFHTSCTSPNLSDNDCTPPDLLQRCHASPDSRPRKSATTEPFQKVQTSSDPLRSGHKTSDSVQRGRNSPYPLQRSHTTAEPFQKVHTSPDPLQRNHANSDPLQRRNTSPDLLQRSCISPDLFEIDYTLPDPFQRSHSPPDPLQRSCISPDRCQRGIVYHQPQGLLRHQAVLDTSLLRNILTNQEIMMDQMKIIYRTVQGLKSVSEEDIGLEANLLPVADLQSLQNLEERLRKFPDFQKQLISMLAMKGGTDTRDGVWRIMTATITNSLAKNINMRGVNGKISFKSLQLRNIVLAAVRKNRLTQHATDQEIESTIQRWLQLAPDRDGGRRERLRKKEAQIGSLSPTHTHSDV
ncbi:uncharacterized protein LOC113066597 isoform X2 [Carassius auratus]|nr:uncharacterized protein LOC113066597 isoform X2 [Carassius auratus]